MDPKSNAANPFPGETNPLPVRGSVYHATFHDAREVDWTEPGLRITRFRILSDPGFPAWDVSYCHGYVGDEPVHVRLPFSQLPKRCTYRDRNGVKKPGGWRAALIAECRRAGLNAHKLGILSAASTLQ